MSTFRNPVGPQPGRVYWRRRLVLALGLVAVILIVILIVNRPGASSPVTTPTPGSTPAAAAEPGPTAKPGETVACDPTMVTVEPTTDAASYDAGVTPVVSFTLTSRMTNPCTIPAGSDLQEFVITSGNDRIWSSKDCQGPPEAATATLQPGVALVGSTVTWDRTRSSVDTCETERPQVDAAGATYRLQVNIGDVKSAAAQPFLLN